MRDERLQKVLARAGIASRRAAESLITAGRVRVDGRVVSELGVKVGKRARIEVDGRIVVAEPLVYIVLHKPRGVVCTLKDPEGRPTIAEYLKDVGARVVPVGRLDFHTSGALICTNDGEVAAKLTHPRHHAKKEYVAKVGGNVDEKTLGLLRERIMIDGRPTAPAEVSLLRVEDGKSWVKVKLGEGRNRQVRRLGEHAGVPVMRLVRVGHAGITAEDLRPGEWRRLTNDELRALKQEYGVPHRIHASDPNTQISRGGHLALRQPAASASRSRDRAPLKPGPRDIDTRARDRDWAAPRALDERAHAARGPAPRGRATEAHGRGAEPRNARGPAPRGRATEAHGRGAEPRNARGRATEAHGRGAEPRNARGPAPRGRATEAHGRGAEPRNARGPAPRGRATEAHGRGPAPRNPRPRETGAQGRDRGPAPRNARPRETGAQGRSTPGSEPKRRRGR